MTDTIKSRIAVVSDGHYNYDADNSQVHDDALSLLQSIHNERPIDILVYNGDIVHDDKSVHQTVINQFFDDLPSAIDWYATRGNHDFVTPAEFENIYGQPSQYSFDFGPNEQYGAIITDTGGSSTSPDTSASDAAWIESEIDSFVAADKDGVFVFQHVEPFEDTAAAGRDMPDVRTQFQRDIVKAVFVGHNHNKNWTEYRQTVPYHYSCMIGGYDASDITDRPAIADGLRIMDVKL